MLCDTLVVDKPADEDESGDQQAPGVTATSTQEWLGRGEIPADMDADNLDPYSAWQQGR